MQKPKAPKKTGKKAVPKRRTKDENERLRDHAKMYYLNGTTNQRELAERVGVSVTTINAWINDGGWEQQRESLLVTRDVELSRLYRQLTALNDQIESRKDKPYADSKEADILSKLGKTIKDMETETSLSQIIEVSSQLVNYIKQEDFEFAKQFMYYADALIKSKAKGR